MRETTFKIDNNIFKCYLYKSRFTSNVFVHIETGYNKQQASTQFSYDLVSKKYVGLENENILTKCQKNILEKKILKMWGFVVNE